ncbi:MAG: extracellular solute-binding protein [Chlamydiales bacterium]|nr:extracellular solute-binding protein [Chlamydiales bacterium]
MRRQVKEGIFLYAGKNNDAKFPFIQRKVAFFMQGSSHATWLANEVQFAMGAGQIPSLEKGQKEKHAFPLGGAAIWVMNNDQTRNALKDVRAFLDYLASDEVQGELHKKTASVSVSVTLPLALQEFYKDHPVHQAVISQTIEATLGEHSYGIRMPDYLKTRLALFDLIEKIVDVQNTPDDKVDDLLAEFDKTYSIPEPK